MTAFFVTIVVILVILVIFVGLYFGGSIIITAVGTAFSMLIGVTAAFFTFGTLPFWLLAGAVSLFIAWCIGDGDPENKEPLWSGTATGTLLLFGALALIINKNLLNFNGYWQLGFLFIGFISYLVLGGVWSAFRYYRFGIYQRGKIEAWSTEQLAHLKSRWNFQNLEAIGAILDGPAPIRPADSRDYEAQNRAYNAYTEAQNYKTNFRHKLNAVRASNNISRIMVWIGFWPWSIIAWVLRDPVQIVYEMMLHIYDSIYMKVFGSMHEQLSVLSKEKK